PAGRCGASRDPSTPGPRSPAARTARRCWASRALHPFGDDDLHLGPREGRQAVLARRGVVPRRDDRDPCGATSDAQAAVMAVRVALDAADALAAAWLRVAAVPVQHGRLQRLAVAPAV